MDDLPTFDDFISTKCGLTVNLARYETFIYVNSFNALLATSDAEIDDFVKSTHATNSGRPANGKIMIPTSPIDTLKDLIF